MARKEQRYTESLGLPNDNGSQSVIVYCKREVGLTLLDGEWFRLTYVQRQAKTDVRARM